MNISHALTNLKENCLQQHDFKLYGIRPCDSVMCLNLQANSSPGQASLSIYLDM